MPPSSLVGEKDAQRTRGGETKMPLRRAARPLLLLSVEPHPPLSRGWHRALASGPVAGSATYTLRSRCDVLPILAHALLPWRRLVIGPAAAFHICRIRIAKDKTSNKIDAIVALSMACVAARGSPPAHTGGGR